MHPATEWNENLEVVLSALDRMISGMGFGPVERLAPEILDPPEDAKPGQWMWKRRCGWREETIFARYLPSTGGKNGWFSLGLMVLAHLPDDRRFVLDVVDVRNSADPTGRYPLPASVQLEAFVPEVLATLRLGLSWFGSYDTARSALERLKSTRRNGIPPGSSAHDDVTQLLLGIAQGEDAAD